MLCDWVHVEAAPKPPTRVQRLATDLATALASSSLPALASAQRAALLPAKLPRSATLLPAQLPADVWLPAGTTGRVDKLGRPQLRHPITRRQAPPLEGFRHDHFEQSEPVVLLGAMDDWACMGGEDRPGWGDLRHGFLAQGRDDWRGHPAVIEPGSLMLRVFHRCHTRCPDWSPAPLQALVWFAWRSLTWRARLWVLTYR